LAITGYTQGGALMDINSIPVPDEVWRSATTAPRHTAITIPTMPLLRRHAYEVGRRGPG
jgi:hypothetical protein